VPYSAMQCRAVPCSAVRLALCGLPALNPLPTLQVHAYDDARAYLDWSNLTHQAATPCAAPAKANPCRGSCAPPRPAAATIALHAAISMATSRHLPPSPAISRQLHRDLPRHLPPSRSTQACTEIRAASLSGDCTWNREARATPPRRAAPHRATLPPAPRCHEVHVVYGVACDGYGAWSA
jgi:hypothetical protein